MSIASLVLSSVASQLGAAGGKSSIREQAGQDFEQLFQALQSGNLAGAQQAYGDLQQLRSAGTSGAVSTTPVTGSTRPVSATPPTAANPLAADWSKLGQALDAGSLTEARSALSQLRQDAGQRWQSEMEKARAVYALMSGAASGAMPVGQGAGNVLQADLASLKASLQAGDTAGAQRLLAQLEQDLQSSAAAGQTRHHHHRHHGGLGSGDSLTATAAPPAAAVTTGATAAAAG